MNDDDKTNAERLHELNELRQRIVELDQAAAKNVEYELAVKALRKEAERGGHLLQLYEKASKLTDKELYDFALDEVVYLTDSKIGFFHLVSDNQEDLILTTWNREALKNCTASYSTHYAMELAGNWVDSVRLKRPVVYNDFPNSPNRKGLPEGHAPIRRFMSTPVFEGDKIRFIFGVGNKVEEYGETDVVHIQLVANELHKIIAQRRSEEALRESEERFRSLVEQSPVSIVIIEAMKVRYANSKYAEMHGYASAEELLNLPIKSLIAPDSWEQFSARAMNREKGLPAETIYETLGVRKDGAEFYALVTASRINLADGPASIGFVQDITERKQAEEEISRLNAELCQKVAQLVDVQNDLIRKEKLAILGQLSGSVGHELRNPLGVMSNAVYFLQMGNADETTREYLDIIKHGIDNSLRIITDLLDFARTKPPQQVVVSAEAVVRQSLQRCTIPENVAVTVDLPVGLPRLNVDPPQMGQILTNIITNGVQAMPDGGALRVAARLISPGVGAGLAPAQSPPAQAGYPQGAPLQDFVEISVTDSGEGISPENMTKLFQPLFTTKARGIGLGLVVCKNLVAANGGKIEVESAPGEGTTFMVLLPIERGEI